MMNTLVKFGNYYVRLGSAAHLSRVERVRAIGCADADRLLPVEWLFNPADYADVIAETSRLAEITSRETA